MRQHSKFESCVAGISVSVAFDKNDDAAIGNLIINGKGKPLDGSTMNVARMKSIASFKKQKWQESTYFV